MGYELLFRDGLSNVFPEIEGTEASSRVLSGGYFSMGIETLTGTGKAFINFTKDMLVCRVPMMFPKEQLVVEVLEDVEPDEEVMEACREMAEQGYTIALDDFLFRPGLVRLLEMAHIIKFDLTVTPLKSIIKLVDGFSAHGIKILAEKVETYEQFRQALDMGFDYFQGYFFSRPEVLRGTDTSIPQMNLLEIMAEANRGDMEFRALEKIIEMDVGISYKLLRYINSAYFRPLCEITSIRQAMVMMGETGVRRFVSLMAMAGLASEKPDELVRESSVRARFCESLADLGQSTVDRSKLFTLGLFSLIDAIMDDKMESLMEKIPLARDIKEALVQGGGILGAYLHLMESYQTGAWAEVSELSQRLGVPGDVLPACFRESVAWADGLVDL